MKVITTVVLLLVAVAASAQYPPQFPPVTKQVELKRYINGTLGFQLSYPATYKRSRPEGEEASIDTTEGREVLLYTSTGVGKSRGSIKVALDPRRFDLKTIAKHYEHMGWADAVPFQIADRTFYYIGSGGGGVTYPDTFFYNLRGRILVIEFDGPYPPQSKSPSEATRAIEKLVLESFRVVGQSKSDR